MSGLRDLRILLTNNTIAPITQQQLLGPLMAIHGLQEFVVVVPWSGEEFEKLTRLDAPYTPIEVQR